MERVLTSGIVSKCVYVNVRKKPTLDSEVLFVLDVGTRVEIVSETSKFYKIMYNNSYGYIMKEYLYKLVEEKNE